MIELIEVDPLPDRCLNCPEAKEGEELGLGPDAYCYNCDYALDRWKIVKKGRTGLTCSPFFYFIPSLIHSRIN